jgi:hypothetical protein
MNSSRSSRSKSPSPKGAGLPPTMGGGFWPYYNSAYIIDEGPGMNPGNSPYTSSRLSPQPGRGHSGSMSVGSKPSSRSSRSPKGAGLPIPMGGGINYGRFSSRSRSPPKSKSPSPKGAGLPPTMGGGFWPYFYDAERTQPIYRSNSPSRAASGGARAGAGGPRSRKGASRSYSRSKSPRSKSPRSKSPRSKSPRSKSPRSKSPRSKSPSSRKTPASMKNRKIQRKPY